VSSHEADGGADYLARVPAPASARGRAPGGPGWEERDGDRRARRVGDLVVVAGTTAPGDDAGVQATRAIGAIAGALERVGAVLEDVVLTRMFVVDLARWADAVGKAHAAAFADAAPVATMVGVPALVAPDLLVEVEALAVVGAGRRRREAVGVECIGDAY
jgi:enamine deaminase RidA (YjgF/YER057c/UK114 family)